MLLTLLGKVSPAPFINADDISHDISFISSVFPLCSIKCLLNAVNVSAPLPSVT